MKNAFPANSQREYQVIIQFSRHAKRRAALYKIPESEVESILAVLELADGEHVLVSDISGFKYPIKIVVAVENEVATVITNYPLKKGRIK